MKNYLLIFLILINLGCPIAEEKHIPGFTEVECNMMLVGMLQGLERNSATIQNKADYIRNGRLAYASCVSLAKEFGKDRESEKYFNLF